MKVRFLEKPSTPPHVFMRAAGYAQKISPGGETSYVKRLHGFDFPRFHIYVQNARELFFTIHIDMKAPVYEGFSAHAGEYDGSLIEQELARLQHVFGVPLRITG